MLTLADLLTFTALLALAVAAFCCAVLVIYVTAWLLGEY